MWYPKVCYPKMQQVHLNVERDERARESGMLDAPEIDMDTLLAMQPEKLLEIARDFWLRMHIRGVLEAAHAQGKCVTHLLAVFSAMDDLPWGL